MYAYMRYIDKETRMFSTYDHHFSRKKFKEVLFQVFKRVEKEIDEKCVKRKLER